MLPLPSARCFADDAFGLNELWSSVVCCAVCIQAVGLLVVAATLTKEQGRQAGGSQAALQILVGGGGGSHLRRWFESAYSSIGVYVASGGCMFVSRF